MEKRVSPFVGGALAFGGGALAFGGAALFLQWRATSGIEIVTYSGTSTPPTSIELSDIVIPTDTDVGKILHIINPRVKINRQHYGACRIVVSDGQIFVIIQGHVLTKMKKDFPTATSFQLEFINSTVTETDSDRFVLISMRFSEFVFTRPVSDRLRVEVPVLFGFKTSSSQELEEHLFSANLSNKKVTKILNCTGMNAGQFIHHIDQYHRQQARDILVGAIGRQPTMEEETRKYLLTQIGNRMVLKSKGRAEREEAGKEGKGIILELTGSSLTHKESGSDILAFRGRRGNVHGGFRSSGDYLGDIAISEHILSAPNASEEWNPTSGFP